MVSDYKQVPVSEAQRLSIEYQKDQVVILCYDRRHELTHTTTFGVTAFDKENAAAVGELCSQAIGCDLSKKQTFEDFHNDYKPALFKERGPTDARPLASGVHAADGAASGADSQGRRSAANAEGVNMKAYVVKLPNGSISKPCGAIHDRESARKRATEYLMPSTEFERLPHTCARWHWLYRRGFRLVRARVELDE